MMRIITGKARGVRLSAPQGEHTRPTAEQTKEAIFSILQFDLLHARVLDLFAGSGQMGLEAVSRGAKAAVLCDNSRDAIEVIRANAKKTGLLDQCNVIRGDSLSILHTLPKQKFHIVFLDPPYAAGLIPQALRTLIGGDLLENGAKLMCEAASYEDVFAKDTELASHFQILRQAHYGVAYVTLLQYQSNDTQEIKV